MEAPLPVDPLRSEPPRSNLDPSGPRWVLPVAIAVALAVGGAFWWSRAPSTPQSPAETPRTVPATGDPALAAAGADEPPAGAGEAAALLERASADRLFRAGLAAGDLVRRWVTVTDNIAEGASPRAALPFLAPRARFSVVRDGPRAVIAPAAYARYDAVASAVDSVDAAAVAAAYRRLHGVLEAAFGALGAAGTLDRATVRALRRIADAPVPDAAPEVELVDGLWAFRDPKLEALPDAEKHLLRMGPRNARLVQEKARQLLDALRLPAPSPR